MYRFITNLTTTTLLTVGVIVIMSPANADMSHDSSGHHDSGGHSAETSHHGDHHSHGMIVIPEGQPVPKVVVNVFPDSVSGWNIQVQTENWTFAPERVNESSVTTEGHAHLYLNDKKLTRIYSEWHYLPSLPPGKHTLTVSLNANGHEALIYNGEPIEAFTQVTVSETSVGM